MPLLYSNIPPLRLDSDKMTIQDYMNKSAELADKILIVVGYASKNSLIELDRIVKKYKLSNVVLVLGMYYIEGFPEGIYNTALRLNDEWKTSGIGEIRVTKSMKYHGKLYAFYAKDKIFASIIGSHNLGAIKKEASNLRQYELSFYTEDRCDLEEIDNHIKDVITSPVSVNIEDMGDVNIIHEENEKLNGVEGVIKVDGADVAFYKHAQMNIVFEIPLKVPGMPDESNDFMKSNINKCYAKGRENKRTHVVTERGWWETEIIVSKKITRHKDYPEKDVPFYVITDDGWKFKMHASGDSKKNLESHDDLKILGYWLKGRLVAAGFVEPVDSPAEDLLNVDNHCADIYCHCKGVITYKKLQKYGRTTVTLTKTCNSLADDDGNLLEVWVLSFLPENVR